jgi:nucleotide-binding universal stress UspA family protein
VRGRSGPQSAKTLNWAATFAREFGAKLTLLHAMACGPEVQLAAGEELRELQVSSGADADLLLETGEPAPAICDAAARLHVDVLVIGRGSPAGVFGRLRTNAYAIIRHSPCQRLDGSTAWWSGMELRVFISLGGPQGHSDTLASCG